MPNYIRCWEHAQSSVFITLRVLQAMLGHLSEEKLYPHRVIRTVKNDRIVQMQAPAAPPVERSMLTTLKLKVSL
jgi:DNA recombination-dependent growth factor C